MAETPSSLSQHWFLAPVGGGGEGVGILWWGWGVSPGSLNPDPISDQKI